MRLLTWNIRASQSEPTLTHVCAQHDSTVMVLTEYLIPRTGDYLQQALRDAGWMYQVSSQPASGERGVLIVSREPLEQRFKVSSFQFGGLASDLDHRIAEIFLPRYDLSIIGVYMPFADGVVKDTLWQALIDYATKHAIRRFVIAGDVNSCLPNESETGRSYTSQPLRDIKQVTIDAWEQHTSGRALPARDRYTWYWKGRGITRGIRLDYIFLSPALHTALVCAQHHHAVREQQLSDHSALSVDLDI
jgi:exodeoxyribonuclease-3